jgi:protein-disulfide isomerase
MEDMDSKLTVYLLLGLALGLVLGGAIGYLYAKTTITTGVTANIDAPPQTQQPRVTAPPATPPPELIEVDMKELVDDDQWTGDENAPVVIVEFSDFQCPFCERWATETLPQLTQTYIDTGKVRLVYRDFPLSSIHPEAQNAAESAECARDQGKFWEYHDTLFENRMDWSGVGDAKFKQYAADLGLDTSQFNDCLDSDKYKNEVLDDLNAGGSVGVSGTPTFFINGKKLVGAQPFENFVTVIEEELA